MQAHLEISNGKKSPLVSRPRGGHFHLILHPNEEEEDEDEDDDDVISDPFIWSSFLGVLADLISGLQSRIIHFFPWRMLEAPLKCPCYLPSLF